jgi:hypothetical protein
MYATIQMPCAHSALHQLRLRRRAGGPSWARRVARRAPQLYKNISNIILISSAAQCSVGSHQAAELYGRPPSTPKELYVLAHPMAVHRCNTAAACRQQADDVSLAKATEHQSSLYALLQHTNVHRKQFRRQSFSPTSTPHSLQTSNVSWKSPERATYTHLSCARPHNGLGYTSGEQACLTGVPSGPVAALSHPLLWWAQARCSAHFEIPVEATAINNKQQASQ